MSANLTEMKTLVEKRNNVITQAREIVEKAKTENRGLTTEEAANHAAAMDEAASIKTTLDAEARQAEAERQQEEFRTVTKPIFQTSDNASSHVEARSNVLASDEYRSAYAEYLRTGDRGPLAEYRAITGADPVAPTQLFGSVIEKLTAGSIIRPRANVQNFDSNIEIPVETTPGTAVWLAEGDTVAGDEPALEAKSLKAHKLGKLIPVPNEVVADEKIDLTNYLASAIARAHQNAEEQEFAIGTLATRPNGVVTGASVGVTAASATALTAAELLAFRRSLKTQYRPGAVIMGHEDVITAIEQLQSTVAQTQVPVFQPAVAFGQPDRLLGIEFISNPWMANTLEAGNKVLVYGNLQNYMIADRSQLVIDRSTDFKFDVDQTVYRAIKRTDAVLPIAESFVAFQMAAL